MVPGVPEGGRRVHRRTCAKHGTCSLPLIDLKRLEAGYPKEVDPDKAEELRMTQLDLSAKIIGDINLCGGGTTPV